MKQKDIGVLASIGENEEFLNRVQAACNQASENLKQCVVDLRDSIPNKAQGFFAESWHAETFNVDAILNRMEGVKAHVLKSNGYKSADIVIDDNGTIIKEISSKSYSTAKQSVDQQKGYQDMERLIPGDQIGNAQEYLNKQIPKDYSKVTENRNMNAQELESIQEKLTDRACYEKAESEPLGRKEAETKYKEVKRGEEVVIQPQIDAAKIAEESLRSGAIAAGITISMTVAPRIYNSIVHRCKEGEWPPEALKTIVNGTANAAAEAGLRGAVATSLTMSAKAGLLGEAMRTVDPIVIGTMTYIAFEGVKDFTKYANGELTGELLADSLMAKSISASAGAYGAAIGQTMIPIPVVGAMIGAMVGSFVAQNGYRFLDTVSESYFRSEQFEEMKRINVALAGQWNDFLNSYDSWVVRNQYYQQQKDNFIRKATSFDVINRQINSELMQALEADDE